MKFNALFQPIQIGGMRVKNRLVMPPMGSGMANPDGTFSPAQMAYYEERAKGGFGLITIEITAFSKTTGPGSLSLAYDHCIDSFRTLAERIHRHGAKVSVQLWHPGRQDLGQSLAPSAIPCPWVKISPVEMTTAQCYEMIEEYIDAAERAYKAGIDAVEVHGAHGYLVAEFMSAFANRRVDEFGGSFYNRMRFPRLIVEGIRRRLGNDYPLIFRMGGVEHTVGGRELLETRAIARMMAEAGINAFHITSGTYASMQWIWGATDMQPGYMAQYAEDVKKSVSVPVIGVGRINDPHYAEELVASGRVDLVSIGRGSIADPHFPNKALAGEFETIAPCIGCHEGCTGNLFSGKTISCIANPFVGHEGETLPAAATAKKIMIAGAGPAGMTAAWILAQRGHQVTVYDKEPVIGGQFRVAAYPPAKGELTKTLVYLYNMGLKYGVKFVLQTTVDEALIAAEKPEVILLATGAAPLRPASIAGIDHPEILLANQVLTNQSPVSGPKVLVAGGGMIGCEVADYLCGYGHHVTLVERLDDIAMDMNPIAKINFMHRLRNYANLNAITGFEITAIQPDGVTGQKAGQAVSLTGFDQVILALGTVACNPLEEVVQNTGIAYHVLGDAKAAGRVLTATREAFEIARQI